MRLIPPTLRAADAARAACALLAMLALHAAPPSAIAAGPMRWWLGDWSDGYANGRCTVKVEASRGQFRREITCPNGVDARWGGEWSAEYRDGACHVRQIATNESLVEEVECTTRR